MMERFFIVERATDMQQTAPTDSRCQTYYSVGVKGRKQHSIGI